MDARPVGGRAHIRPQGRRAARCVAAWRKSNRPIHAASFTNYALFCERRKDSRIPRSAETLLALTRRRGGELIATSAAKQVAEIAHLIVIPFTVNVHGEPNKVRNLSVI